MNSFYNTINLSGEALSKVNIKAISLENLIKELFKNNIELKISPSQLKKLCEEKLDKKNIPLTSYRRALTNLSSEMYGNILMKTDEMCTGLFDLPEHKWALREADALKKHFNSIIKSGAKTEKELKVKSIAEVSQVKNTLPKINYTQIELFNNGTAK